MILKYKTHMRNEFRMPKLYKVDPLHPFLSRLVQKLLPKIQYGTWQPHRIWDIFHGLIDGDV